MPSRPVRRDGRFRQFLKFVDAKQAGTRTCACRALRDDFRPRLRRDRAKDDVAKARLAEAEALIEPKGDPPASP